MRDIHRANAHTRIHVAWHERAHERLEIAVDAGSEAPLEVHRELVRRTVPRSLRAVVRVGDRLAETGAPAHFECRREKGGVGGVRLQLARAEQPAVADVGIRAKCAAELREIRRRGRSAQRGVQMNVCPRPLLTRDREDVLAARGWRQHER